MPSPNETTKAREHEVLHLLARERLRNSLLAAISHDLRTLLAALVGMAESLALADVSPAGRVGHLARNLREAAARMSSQVNNAVVSSFAAARPPPITMRGRLTRPRLAA